VNLKKIPRGNLKKVKPQQWWSTLLFNRQKLHRKQKRSIWITNAQSAILSSCSRHRDYLWQICWPQM